ncbi:MAG: DUF2009 domain-containing protein [Pedobacter sp.]|nr:MAG: DUF2009 domain-containing protein [Pedobacter sp.]
MLINACNHQALALHWRISLPGDERICETCRREISHDMFKLWYLAESDLLNATNPYRLTNTGQGLNRVQQVRLSEHFTSEWLYAQWKPYCQGLQSP